MTRASSSFSRPPADDAPDPLPNRLIRLLSEARWVAFAVIGVYLTLVLYTYAPGDSGWSHAGMGGKPTNWGGAAGAWLADLMLYVFGFTAWWFCVALMASVWVSYRRLAQRFLLQRQPEQPHRHEMAIRAGGFVLMVLGSSGIEFVRMYSMTVKLPRDPGGVLGETFGGMAQSLLGFNGGTLVLLALFGLGFSLCFHVSWMAVAEKLGGAIESAAHWAMQMYAARQDRKIGQEAVVKREETMVKEREKIVEATPIQIVPQVVNVPKSERVQKEKQVSLFLDLPDTNLPPLSLLDEPPLEQETVSVETLEFTSRLIERKLGDFGVEVKVVAA